MLPGYESIRRIEDMSLEPSCSQVLRDGFSNVFCTYVATMSSLETLPTRTIEYRSRRGQPESLIPRWGKSQGGAYGKH